jgi:leucyl-tRNA synthetase
VREAASSPAEFAVVREAIESLLVMLSPFVPHITQELWEALGHADSLYKSAWPGFDASWAEEQEATIAVQVNGKLRATITVPKDSDQAAVEALALAEPNVKRFTEGAQIKKVIYVPNKIVNVIAALH